VSAIVLISWVAPEPLTLTLVSKTACSRPIAWNPANRYARGPRAFFISLSAASTVSASSPTPSSSVSGHAPHSPFAQPASMTRCCPSRMTLHAPRT